MGTTRYGGLRQCEKKEQGKSVKERRRENDTIQKYVIMWRIEKMREIVRERGRAWKDDSARKGDALRNKDVIERERARTKTKERIRKYIRVLGKF